MPKGAAVQSMFAGIARSYDTANHLLSGGIDWYWRWRMVRAVKRHSPRRVLDLATGSGDVAFALHRHLPSSARILALDFCEPMLDQARAKQQRRTIARDRLEFGFGDCLQLPVPDGDFDAITIAFGLRNLEDRHRGLCEMRRALDPQHGALFILEFTQPAMWFRPVYFAYLRWLLPSIARLATGDRGAYEYLVGSIDQFPPKEAISAEIRAAGFRDVTAIGLTGSAVALHCARP